MNDKIKQTLEYYCQNELNDFYNSEYFSEIKNLADAHNFVLERKVWKADNDNKLYLIVRVLDGNNLIVEIWDDGSLVASTELVSVDKRERVKFFPWDDEDFVDSLNWIIKCLKNIH